MDVLSKAEEGIASIAAKVRESGFEYADFKIAFSISIEAYLRRLIVLKRAEESLQTDFSKHFDKASLRGSGGGNLLDFKEVYKWIVSPLLAQ